MIRLLLVGAVLAFLAACKPGVYADLTPQNKNSESGLQTNQTPPLVPPQPSR
jgi:hypothetical protein